MPPRAAKPATPKKQLLHLVFGGELTGVESVEFKDLKNLDIIGMFPDYDSAYVAWQAAARRTIDNAHMRYFIVHLHKLLDPEVTGRGRPRASRTAKSA